MQFTQPSQQETGASDPWLQQCSLRVEYLWVFGRANFMIMINVYVLLPMNDMILFWFHY